MNNNFPNNMNTSNSFPNGLNPPYGYNDNNFNRKIFPSNIYPMNGGMSGNPMNRFNPVTTNTLNQLNNMPSISNFNKAYELNNPLIEKIDYSNKNNLLHNNVADTVLDENVVEYRLNIDSLDRDIRYYPDPFSFVVKFNPIAGGIVQTEVPIDYYNKSVGTRIEETRFEGAPMPHINKEFRNVKYIKLENIILPQHGRIIKNDEGKYVSDADCHLISDRFVSLIIKELDCDRVFATSDGTSRIDHCGNCYTPNRSFAIIIPDKLLGTTYYAGTPYYGTKIYKSGFLGNIKQLSIQFADSTGIPLKFNNLYTYDDLQQYEFDNGFPLPLNDIRHPLNKKIQIHLSFIIGVVESQINTNTKFEY